MSLISALMISFLPACLPIGGTKVFSSCCSMYAYENSPTDTWKDMVNKYSYSEDEKNYCLLTEKMQMSDMNPRGDRREIDSADKIL